MNYVGMARLVTPCGWRILNNGTGPMIPSEHRGLQARTMDRAFSPHRSWVIHSWGVAPGCHGGAPLALVAVLSASIRVIRGKNSPSPIGSGLPVVDDPKPRPCFRGAVLQPALGSLHLHHTFMNQCRLKTGTTLKII